MTKSDKPQPDKMRLWKEFFKTDPDFTKGFSRSGGFKGTDINPLWRMSRMTEVFGPIGQGWGYDILEDKEVHLTDGRAMWFSKVRVWYTDPEVAPGEKFYIGPQWGGTALIDARKDGRIVMDDEAPKKSVTDGIGKCLSYLGVSADVYLGYWDDSKYVNDLRREFSASDGERAKKSDEGTNQQDAELLAWRDSVVAHIKTVTELTVLEKWWKDPTQANAFKECTEKNPDIARFVKTQVAARAAKLKEVAATP